MNVNKKIISDEKLKELDKYMLISGDPFNNMLIFNYTLPEWFIQKYKDNLNWHNVFKYQNLSMEFLEKNMYYINDFNGWDTICKHQNLSIDFIRNNKDNIDWPEVILYQFITKELITEFYSEFDLLKIRQRNLIEDFITDEELDNLEIMHQITK